MTAAPLAATLRTHERHLRALCYRMTGSLPDAEDLVQETFARALAQPGFNGGPPTAWLTRVATNLARDFLRRRRRIDRIAPSVPAPLGTGGEPVLEIAAARPTPEDMYAILEGVPLAFLVALEALTARQRAVLLLRDVLGHSTRETAAVLGISEDNVRTIGLRARRSLGGPERAQATSMRPLRERHRAALERLVAALLSGNPAELETLLAAARAPGTREAA